MIRSSPRAAQRPAMRRGGPSRAPADTEALVELAATYHRDGRLMDALKAYDRVIELGGADAGVWCATGDALAELGEYAQAVGAYERGLALDAENAAAHHNLGRALYQLGESDAALPELRWAAALSDSVAPRLALATMIPGWPPATQQEILDVRREAGARMTAGGAARARPSVRAGTGGRLRIGYVSGHFDRPNYMKPVWALINHHDRGSFAVHLFSDRPVTDLAGYVPHGGDAVHETAALDNGALAELIRSCGIDILVDLNAYSLPERLALFDCGPAPVVMAWFNMYATSGLSGVDYIVGDDNVVLRGEDRFFSEKVLRLPVGYLTFQVCHPVPPVAPPPCLRQGAVTFGSLVTQYKITGPVVEAWSDILRRTEGSRLLLANRTLGSPCNRDRLLARFGRCGVGADRIEILPAAGHYEYLAYYDRIDLALDAFPYNGGTTTMEAIWQGVPVLTFHGDRWASRTSASLLRDAGLGDFVAPNAEALREAAVGLAGDPESPARLARLRSNMREQVRRSRACDGRRLAAAMEGAYRTAIASRAACG